MGKTNVLLFIAVLPLLAALALLSPQIIVLIQGGVLYDPEELSALSSRLPELYIPEEPAALDLERIAADYLTDSSYTYSDDYAIGRLFLDLSVTPEQAPIVLEPEADPVIEDAPLQSDALRYLGSVNRQGVQAYSFRARDINAAVTLSPGESWRGWQLVEVTNDGFLFYFEGGEYIISR